MSREPIRKRTGNTLAILSRLPGAIIGAVGAISAGAFARALVVCSLIAAQPSRGELALWKYRSILEVYRAGNSKDALAALEKLDSAEVELALRTLVKVENDRVIVEGGPRIWLQTAAVVQLEQSLIRGPLTFVMQGRGPGRDLAWKAVTPLYDPPRGHRPEGPGTDHAFLRAWFHYVVPHETSRGRWVSALQLFKEGEGQLGEDAELLLAAAATHELAWRAEHDEEHEVQMHGDLPAAETMLRRATEIDPALDEARVRLGRVQAKRGESQAALETLSRLQAPKTEAGFVYLARLFEGEIHEGLQQYDRAEAAYRAANAALPSAESAQIALAHLLHQMGRRDEALERVNALATGASTDARNDPWLLYLAGESWRQPNYLDALRAIVRK
jgi:tetratricopeptide (TPR) repeat protein